MEIGNRPGSQTLSAPVIKVTLRERRYREIKKPAHGKEQNSVVWGLIMTLVCPEAGLAKMRMYAKTRTRWQTLVARKRRVRTLATKGRALVHMRCSFCIIFLILNLPSHLPLSAAHTHTQTHTPSLSIQLKGPSLQGLWSWGGQWQWMQISLLNTHTHTHTHTRTHTHTHTHSAPSARSRCSQCLPRHWIVRAERLTEKRGEIQRMEGWRNRQREQEVIQR